MIRLVLHIQDVMSYMDLKAFDTYGLLAFAHLSFMASIKLVLAI